MQILGTTKFGDTAMRAAELAKAGCTPLNAWCSAAAEVFPDSPESEKKSCPRKAFLGLASGGYIKGVPRDDGAKQSANSDYARAAVHYLKQQPDFDGTGRELWRLCVSTQTTYNGQCDVVLALWRTGRLSLSAE